MIEHPLFERFAPYRKASDNWIEAQFAVDFPNNHPGHNEELFEWLSMLGAVFNAREQFVMLELGAGYGRWGILAALAAKAIGIKHVRVRLIEAEPQHAAWAAETAFGSAASTGKSASLRPPSPTAPIPCHSQSMSRPAVPGTANRS